MIQEYFEGISRQLCPAALSWDNVRRAYAGRAYHNLSHLEEMVFQLKHHDPPTDPVMLGVALIYHDIVYKPSRVDNESRSASSAVRALGTCPSLTEERVERCREMILATRKHIPSAGDDGDEALLIDLDLAVLARKRDGYDHYVSSIRQEFWMVPYFVFRNGRSRVITNLLDRETIFHTERGRTNYEAAARENLWRELRNL